MSITARTLIALLASLVCVAACGQKGPLYLPGDPNQAQTQLPAQLPELESADEQNDDDEHEQ